MIVDVHSHAWDFPNDFSDAFIAQAKRARAGMEVDLSVRLEDYDAGCPSDEEVKTIVFGGKAKLSGMWVDDQTIADYVAQAPDRLIGFQSIDPTVDGWADELRHGHQELGLKGIKLLPMYAGFHPQDPMMREMWVYAQKHSLPVLLHTGTTFISQAPIEMTLPRHLDEVATDFPDVKIICAHLGHPYEGECVAVIRKHPNVYADISALFYRPFQLYQSLMLVQEYGVWEKVLFGTDYPFTSVSDTMDGVRNLNNMLEGSALPRLDTEQIEAMIYRDSLGLLGLA